MSLIYRAMWDEDESNTVDRALECFRVWVLEKYPSMPIDDQSTSMTVNGHVISVDTVLGDIDGVSAIQAALTEERGTERWMTRLRAFTEVSGDHCVWVDVERVADDLFGQHEVAAPRLVRQLLDESRTAGANPRLGPAPMRSEPLVPTPQRVGPELVALLGDPTRSTPVVVYSHNNSDHPDATMERAAAAAKILAGVATVFALSPTSQQEFQHAVGRELSVWGGAARLYLPGELTPVRHRYLRPDIVRRHKRDAGRRFASMLSSSIAARRAPALYEQARPILRSARPDGTEDLLAVAELEIAERNETIDQLREYLQRENDERLDAIGEIEELQKKIESLRYEILRQGMADGSATPDEIWTIPSAAQTLTEAVSFAGEHLTGVVIHPDASRDLEALDSAIECEAWAQTSWVGLRALHAYATEAADFSGGFWEWCEHTKNVDSWPATSKKLSMRESETVMNNERLSAARLLPVAAEVDATGRIVMESHLKIAEGGGNLAPRIYFYDDTKGTTGKVHIGFFGPHKYMPNTKS